MVRTGDKLWQPDAQRISRANITHFMSWLGQCHSERLSDYPSLWRWSIEDIDRFWTCFAEYFDIDFKDQPHTTLGKRAMPGAEWFPGATLNFAEHVMRNERANAVAICAYSECRAPQNISWPEFGSSVRRMAQALRAKGIAPGDRVACYLPNIVEAAISFLAVTAIGGIWTSTSPDFGTKSVLDRFGQVEPKVLIACDGYRYGGKDFDRRPHVCEMIVALPSVELVIWLPYLDKSSSKPADNAIDFQDLLTGYQDPGADDFKYEAVAFDHPIWIVYSSGTTGLPKPIVHGHGGITLEMMKFLAFHLDMHEDDRKFFFTTTGWVMWNITISSMITGGAAVIYDGHPARPDPDVLWRIASDAKATIFGASPTYVQSMMNAGVVPKRVCDLSCLKTVMLGGSPATPETMNWFYENVGDDLLVTSQSGGTDVASGFVGASPTLPVHAGEIQTRLLGVDVCAYDDDGNEVIDEIGELVVRQPMPSMPLCFWNDKDMSRYKGSYFEDYAGLWRHGDFFLVNGERGTCTIIGRSDSTLNRFGVRIGTAEIYRSVEELTGVEDSLIVSLDLPNGGFFMPLFVKLAPDIELDETLDTMIRDKLRDDYSPRHVPDAVVAVPDIPYTLTGKKMEVPVRRILMGTPVKDAANPDAMSNPAALGFFEAYADEILR